MFTQELMFILSLYLWFLKYYLMYIGELYILNASTNFIELLNDQ